ncbi:MAG: HAD family hydrolase [Atopobiaceae bacterium]|nr:HAD family hydrolase [Atopobiaceae bacterium]
MQQVKLVAVDEDGTFLHNHIHYDAQRFERIWVRMQELGVRFVVATGNQCYQVQELFANHAHEMGIVSANGAYVLDGNEEVYAARASNEAVSLLINACHEQRDVPFSMLGVKGAYVERGTSQEFFDDMAQYCYRQYWVDDFAEVEDQVFMFSSVVDESVVGEQIVRFRNAVGDLMDVVGSGEGYFDVICPGVSKASGLTYLLNRWGISPDECVAFGDSDNDLAMLSLVGCGYAMQNAPAHVRAAADRVAPSCDDDGVLQVLEELFSL